MTKKKGPGKDAFFKANQTGKEERKPALQVRNERGQVEPIEGWDSHESEMNALHERVKGAIRDAVRYGIRIGELLTEKKAELAHGEFTPYVEENLSFTKRMASNYIRLFEYRGYIEPALENAEVTGLKDALQLIASTEKFKKETVSLLDRYREQYEAARKESTVISRKIGNLERKKELSKSDFQELEKELKELSELVRFLKSKF